MTQLMQREFEVSELINWISKWNTELGSIPGQQRVA